MPARKPTPRFAKDQALFLRQARDKGLTLQALTLRQKIEPETLSRWLRSPKFRKAIDKAMRHATRLRDFEIDLASVPAARKLTDLSRGDRHGPEASDQVIRLASLNVIYLSRERRSAELSDKLKTGRITAVRDARPRVPSHHPDVPPEEAERLRYALDHPEEVPDDEAA